MRPWALAFVVLAAVGWARSLATSPCLSATPSPKAFLATVRPGSTWYLTESGDAGWAPEANVMGLVCHEGGSKPGQRVQVVSMKNHVAVVYWVDVGALRDVPVTKASWAASRGELAPGEESGQTGCLRAFGPGTVLYDGPDGAPVGVVTGGQVMLGRWEVVDRPSGQWSQTTVRAFGAWVKTKPALDWCPE